MTGVGDAASYLQRSRFVIAMVVPMLVLSWPFLLPTFDKYLKIHNQKAKKLTLKLLIIYTCLLSEQQVFFLINIDSLLPRSFSEVSCSTKGQYVTKPMLLAQ